MMNIHTQEGSEVIYVGGHPEAEEFAGCTSPEGLLETGKKYTVESTEVHRWHTKVKLEGIEGLFNSVLFEDCLSRSNIMPSENTALKPII